MTRLATQHEMDLARIDNAIRAARRDRAARRSFWVRVWADREDEWSRALVPQLARAEMEPHEKREQTLQALRSRLASAPPTIRRHSLLTSRRTAPIGPQERTDRDDLINRDWIRENVWDCFRGGLRRPYARLGRLLGNWPVLAPYDDWASDYTLTCPRKVRVGRHRATGKDLFAPIWIEDDPGTFNSAGSLRYEDGSSDQWTEDDARDRQAWRREAGLSYDAEIRQHPDEFWDEREDQDRDGNEVVTSGELASMVEREDYAPAITRKDPTHVRPVVSTEPVPVTANVLHLPPDPLMLDPFEQWLLWRRHDLLAQWLERPWPLYPDPDRHPGQERPREGRTIDALVWGLAPDGTAWDTGTVARAFAAERAQRPRYGPTSVPWGRSHDRTVDVPHIPVELQPRVLVYDQPRPRPHGALQHVTVTPAMELAAIREFWLPGFKTARGKQALLARAAELEAQLGR